MRRALTPALLLGALAVSLSSTIASDAEAGRGANQECSMWHPCGDGLSCMPFRQRCHRDSGALEGEACQAGYSCAGGLTCEAGSQVCHGPAKVGESCHATHPCAAGLSCAPGVQKCYHAPRHVDEPCSAGYGCGSGLTCEAGSQTCRAPGKVGDACHATRPCGDGLSCQPGVQKCYHSPRQDGEPCVAGYGCGGGLECAPVYQVCYKLPPSPPFHNGEQKRPFYIVGHNPNSFDEISGDLDAGANALEPDIMKFSGNAQYYAGKNINDKAGKSGLFVYHDDVLVTTRDPITVEKYFANVATKVANGKNIALLTIDTKPAAYGSGPALVKAVHEAFDNAKVAPAKRPWVIYNCGDASDEAKKFYGDIAGLLTDREGIMSDGNNDPDTVYTMLRQYTKNQNIAYGTGGQGVTSGSFPHVGLWIDHATWYRTSQDYSAAVPYVYPIPDSVEAGGIDWWGSFMDSDVDGLIPDLDINPVAPATTQSQIRKLKSRIDSSSKYYVATLSDNPFMQGREGYALRVVTGHNGTSSAGTDGNVTFTITGTKGSSSGVFNGRTQIGSATRFHDSGTDYLVIPSKDLGRLKSMTMYVSGAVLHSWKVSQIQISSAQHAIAYKTAPTITVEKTVETTHPVTIDLTSHNLGKP